MFLNQNNEHPIFLQLASAIEDDILTELYKEEDQIISTTEMSVSLKINPATANKAINLLVDQGLIYKKRGLGMFVAPGAREKILRRRQEKFRNSFLIPLLKEAEKIEMSKDRILKMIIKEGVADESD